MPSPNEIARQNYILHRKSLDEANNRIKLKRDEDLLKFTSLHKRLCESIDNLKPRRGITKVPGQVEAIRDTVTQEMNTYIAYYIAEYINDSRPSGVNPHEGLSWRDKYEYMNTLWLKQKDEIAIINKEKQEIYKELQALQSELSEKNTKIATLQSTAILEDTFVEPANIEKFSIKPWLNYTIILFILLVLIYLIQLLFNNTPLLMLTPP
jgi:hypothetical protein